MVYIFVGDEFREALLPEGHLMSYICLDIWVVVGLVYSYIYIYLGMCVAVGGD